MLLRPSEPPPYAAAAAAAASPAAALPYPCLAACPLQLIITHITTRNANVRELLAAQGLVLRQPAAGADGQGDAGALPRLLACCRRCAAHWRRRKPLQRRLPFSGPRIPPLLAGAVCAWLPTMDAACQHCEERFLASAVAHGLCAPPATQLTLAQVGAVLRHAWSGSLAAWADCRARRLGPVPSHLPHVPPTSLPAVQVLQAHLELPRCVLGGDSPDFAAVAAHLQRFVVRRKLRAGDALFGVGEPAGELFILERGSGASGGCEAAVPCVRAGGVQRLSASTAAPPAAAAAPTHPRPPTPAVVCHLDYALSSVASRAQLPALPPDLQLPSMERSVRHSAGAIIGHVDFTLKRPRRWGGPGCRQVFGRRLRRYVLPFVCG